MAIDLPLERRHLPTLVFLVAVVALAGLLVFEFGYGPLSDREAATVTVYDDEGTKAVVDVEVADTWRERYVGLSEHDSLDHGQGMLFVHHTERSRTYVMRGMDFGIDIVFVGEDRQITTIHHARAPGPGQDGESLRYTGRARWVLEVPRGYVNETRIEAGDRIEIEYRDASERS